MIDAQAVWAHLQELASFSTEQQGAEAFQPYFEQLSLQHERDAEGNYLFTLPGKSDRTVVLGSHLARNPGEPPLDLVTGLETMRALGHRFEGVPPCTLLLVAFANATSGHPESAATAVSAFASRPVAAFLGMHVDIRQADGHAKPSLGVVTGTSAGEPGGFHPRLTALCDEAVRELTGTSVAVADASDETATAVARNGIPTALMYVELPAGTSDGEASNAERLHMLQAAEAFGRWAEATMHLVAGEDVDLWALEERVPHLHGQDPAV